ncbi:unnamed protein product [Spirodela intermedia]|uniref:Uncharacterized protein n=1 Tax=Spirodela intermedia TaxID=51605 RepID=A0A7I8KM77_SPIIN|nr:unnamed protein product [Spirodela intermedia]
MELHLFVIVILVLLPALLLLYLSNRKSEGPIKAYPLIGNLPQFVRHRHRLLEWHTELLAAAASTNTVHFHFFGEHQCIITANPANLEHLLKSNFENYPKGPFVISLMEDFLGRGIFNSDGELWKHQRKTASFEFNTRSLRMFVVENVQQEITKRLLPRLRRATGAAVDLQDVLERFAFDNVCQVAFNEDPACLAADGEDPTDGDGLLRRFRYAIPGMWKVKKLVNVGSERRLKESISTVDDFARRIIRSRKEELSSPAAAEDLHDVIYPILAGRVMTSSALTWFFWLLSERPDVERKILDEIRSVRARSKEGEEEEKESFGFEELREMNYLYAAITEAMRLYPPVPANTSHCLADDVLPDGTKVGKGWFVSYNAYAVGRMTAVWGEDYGKFRPERWLGTGGEFRPESPFRFPASHGGARTCPGKEMAYVQMKSIAACLIEKFTLEVAGGRPEMLLCLTLHMKDGLPVRVRERTPLADFPPLLRTLTYSRYLPPKLWSAR